VAINAGAVPLPVRLVLGEGEPVTIGEMRIGLRPAASVVDGRVAVTIEAVDPAALRNALADLLDQAAADLRKEPDDAPSDPR
jgi:hypothetical protein